jgi:hypothetical protein
MAIVCEMSWNDPVIIACEATIAAKMASTILGQYMPGGTVLKKGFETAVGSMLMNAAWPIYARRRHG